MPKILVTSRSFGTLSSEPAEILKEHNLEINYYRDAFDESIFCQKLSSCHGLIIGSHPLSEQALQSAPNLKIVVKHGTGLDNIDLVMAKKYGVTVDRVPAVNADAVADLTFGLILDVARRISYASSLVRQGNWRVITGTDVCGKTLGLIGFGRIGQHVARRAKGFSMAVMAYDPFLTQLPEEFTDYVVLAPFEEVLARADFLSIHVPLGPSTQNLIGKEQFAVMKPSAVLVNTSRGGIVNEAELYTALKQQQLAGVGLDVLKEEPMPAGHPLRGMDQVTILPHMGMYSKEAMNAVSTAAATRIAEFFK